MTKLERIFLRLLTHDDISDRYLKWFRDLDVTKYLEIDGESLTKEIVKNYIDEGSKNKSYFMYAICLSNNNKNIGNLKIGPINYKHNFSDMVVIIGDKEYWGKGLASEAIRKGIEIAFDKYKIRKLSGGIYSGNISSIKAYTNAGYFIEGMLKRQFVKDGNFHDKILIGCFNPKYQD